MVDRHIRLLAFIWRFASFMVMKYCALGPWMRMKTTAHQSVQPALLHQIEHIAHQRQQINLRYVSESQPTTESTSSQNRADCNPHLVRPGFQNEGSGWASGPPAVDSQRVRRLQQGLHPRGRCLSRFLAAVILKAPPPPP